MRFGCSAEGRAQSDDSPCGVPGARAGGWVTIRVSLLLTTRLVRQIILRGARAQPMSDADAQSADEVDGRCGNQIGGRDESLYSDRRSLPAGSAGTG
jgi:hypothetical protein